MKNDKSSFLVAEAEWKVDRVKNKKGEIMLARVTRIYSGSLSLWLFADCLFNQKKKALRVVREHAVRSYPEE